MTHSKRLRAMKRLRAAAEKAIGAPKWEWIPDYMMGFSKQFHSLRVVTSLGRLGWLKIPSKQFRRLERAWRAFPECERDDAVPPPHEVLTICERMEREQAADDAFAAALAAEGR